MAHVPTPRFGELRRYDSALWWYSRSGEWRIVDETLWTARGEEIRWRQAADPMPEKPAVWDVVYMPEREHDRVLAVRVVSVRPARGEPARRAPFVVRGATVEGDEVKLRPDRREVFSDAVAAALELRVPPRLDAVYDFPV
jgi:hypothetical protein